jgi:uncharacterized OB-fold protein
MNATTLEGIPSIIPGLFRFLGNDERTPELLGGFCPKCHKHFYPRPQRCHYCLESLNEAGLGDTGTIYSYTIIRKKAPFGLPEPYGAGFVDLDNNNLRVFTLFDPARLDELKVGGKVKLAVAVLGLDTKGNPCLRPYFVPQETMPAAGEKGD